MPTTIEVIGENGQVVERDIVNRGAAIVTDLERIEDDGTGVDTDENYTKFEPAATQRIEYDRKGGSTSITTTCGETENTKTSDKKADLTLEGVLTKSQLDDIKSIGEGDEIKLLSDLHSGNVFVKRVIVSQEQDIISVVQDGDEELAFNFQLQLKQP